VSEPPDTRGFLRRYRVYILVPIVVTLLLGALMVVGSRQGAPFVNTLF
jgi:hypothetical protein